MDMMKRIGDWIGVEYIFGCIHDEDERRKENDKQEMLSFLYECRVSCNNQEQALVY